MDGRQATFFGLKQLPRELTAFEIEAFFTFTVAECEVGPSVTLADEATRPANLIVVDQPM